MSSKIYTWGSGTLLYPGSGQNDTIARSSPSQLGTSNWLSIGSAGGIAVRTDGTLWSWDLSNTYGQTGQSSTAGRSSPVQVGADTDWIYAQSS